MELFINASKNQKDLLAILQHEVDANITMEAWRPEDVSGYYVVRAPYNVDVYDIYEVLKFLEIPVTFINVPVNFKALVHITPNDKKIYKQRREPLVTWKNMPRECVEEPVPMHDIMNKLEDRLGLPPMRVYQLK